MVAGTIYTSLEGDDSGTGTATQPFQTLSRSLTAASQSDDIVLTCAASICVYSGASNAGLELTKSVSISGDASKTVVLDAMSSSRVLAVSGRSVTVGLERLSLRGGRALSGAALKIVDATVNMKACTVCVHLIGVSRVA